jgi:hypothetical protein
MATLDPDKMEPVEFAKLCTALIALFFALIIITGIFSGSGAVRPARFLCYISCCYFALTTAYIMYGMVVSFEVARRKFDTYN